MDMTLETRECLHCGSKFKVLPTSKHLTCSILCADLCPEAVAAKEAIRNAKKTAPISFKEKK